MSDFVHLHVHTEYSPSDAPVALGKLTKQAAKDGHTALAITDHGTVGGWVKFQQACDKVGIHPIFGVEAYFTPDRFAKEDRTQNFHFLMIAKNNEGIKNIYKMTEKAWSEGFYYVPRIDWDLLQEHSEGVIATSSCVSGIIPETYVRKGYDKAKDVAGRFKDILKDDFYMEVQYHDLEIERQPYNGMAKIAAKNGMKIVGTNDVHYIHKDEASIQEAMVALRYGKCMKDPARQQHGINQLYLKSPQEMVDVFGGPLSQAVTSTREIANKCTARLQFGVKPNLPNIDIPKEFKDEITYLEHWARQGLRELGKEGIKAYEERFNEEIGVIRKLKAQGYDFDKYFLVVADYVAWAWKNGIRVGAGRGSGAGSLLLYCLRITGVDPIPLGLLFERFLQEDRNEMPDIDIDFDSEREPEVEEYIRQKYGEDHCVRIGTVGTYHAAGALRAAYRVFDPGNDFERKEEAKKAAEAKKDQSKFEYSKRSTKKDQQVKIENKTVQMANETSKLIPRGANNAPDQSYTLSKDKYEEKPDDYTYIYSAIPEFRDLKRLYPDMFRFAEHMEGLIEKRGQHAAGVLITGTPTVELAPKQIVRENVGGKIESAMATAFDMGDVELLGGIKFDFLSTKVLTVITKAMSHIEKASKWKFKFDIDHVPLDDPKALEVFTKGDTLAIFQFEGDGMVSMLQNMNPDSFEDIIAANALYRPGPIQNKDSFINRKKGIEKVEYYSESMQEILKPTYGIMVYQEQVMQLVRVLAGFSASESDKVRKAMGKKKMEILNKLKDKFIKGCAERKTIKPELAEKLWQQMEKFGSYAFNKSHSAGYAFTAYQCAFLKAHFPVEFMAAQLSVEGNDSKYDVISKYERGVKKMGIKILPLCINTSIDDYVPSLDKPNTLRRGFKGIKGIGSSAYTDIVANQPYRDFMDYCQRAGNGTKSDVAKVLIDNGAFEVFRKDLESFYGRPLDSQDLEKEYEDCYKRAQNERREKGKKKEEREGIEQIFGFDEDDDDKAGNLGGNWTL